MNLLWPNFHDPSYRPGFRERMSIHWLANLRMLRHPRDIAVFTVISFFPLVALLLLVQVVPRVFVHGALIGVIAFAAIFLLLQHLAFVLAIKLTYVHHVQAVLYRRGIPVCRRCGQLLAPDRPESACPECGYRPLATTLTDLDSPKHGEPLGHPSQDEAANHAQNGIRR